MSLHGSVALVTGAAGFVGANLVRRLIAEGTEVHAIIRPGSDRWRLVDALDNLVVHDADLVDPERVRRVVDQSAPDVVFHLARHRGSPARVDYREAYRHNLEATLTLLEAVDGRRLRRFVHAASSLEYDLSRSPLRESDAPAPVTTHGVTKAAASLLVQQFGRARGVPAVVLRLFTIYGPWEGPERFVPRLMHAAIEGAPVSVTRTGLSHDWTHVDDAVEALVRGAEADGVAGEIVNVATGRESTNEEVVALMEQIVGHPLDRREEAFPERSWDSRRWVADVTKAQDVLGWRAAIELRTGLARTLEWFRTHHSSYRWRRE